MSITCLTCSGFECGNSPSLKPFNTLILARVPPIVKFFSFGFQKPAIDFNIECIGSSDASGLSIVIPHASHASPRVITLNPKSSLVSNVAPASNALISLAFNPAMLPMLSLTGGAPSGGGTAPASGVGGTAPASSGGGTAPASGGTAPASGGTAPVSGADTGGSSVSSPPICPVPPEKSI